MVDSESDVEMSLEDRLYKRQCLIYRDWVDERDYNASYNCPPGETLVQAMNREMPRYGWIWDAVAREWTKPKVPTKIYTREVWQALLFLS